MQRPEAPVAARRRDEPERRAPEQDRVATTVVRVDRHHDRPRRHGARGEERADGPPDSRGWSPSTMSAARPSGERLDPDAGASSTGRGRGLGCGSGARLATRSPPRCRRRHRRARPRLVDAGPREPIEHVLEDRPALDRREELAAPEPRSGAGGQHDRDDPVGLAHATHARRWHPHRGVRGFRWPSCRGTVSIAQTMLAPRSSDGHERGTDR